MADSPADTRLTTIDVVASSACERSTIPPPVDQRTAMTIAAAARPIPAPIAARRAADAALGAPRDVHWTPRRDVPHSAMTACATSAANADDSSSAEAIRVAT